MLSNIDPVEALATTSDSAVELVPIAPPELSEMPPEPAERVTPLPEAETRAEIVEAFDPEAVKLAEPEAVILLLSASEVPARVN